MKKFIKLCLVLGTVLFCLGSIGLYVRAGQYKAARAQEDILAPNDLAKAAVVKVLGLYDDNAHGGTGFLLNIQSNIMIITNAHICADHEELQIKFNGDPLNYTGYVLLKSRRTDLCMVVPSPDTPLELLKHTYQISNIDPQLGEPLFIYGHPHLIDLTLLRTNYIGKRLMSYTGYAHKEFGPQEDLMSTTIYHGNSGSPVLNSLNHVVGVVSAVYPIQPKSKIMMGAFIPRNDLLEFINFQEGPLQ